MMRWLKILSLFIAVIICPDAVFAQDTPDTSYNTTSEVVEEQSSDENATTTTTPSYVEPVIPNTDQPTDKEWNDLVADKAFSYKDLQELPPKKREEEKKRQAEAGRKSLKEPWIIRILINFFEFLSSTTGLVIMGIIVAGVVVFIAYRLISGEGKLFARDARQMKKNDGEVNEEDLLGSNWETKFQEAIRTNDIRMAIRYSYMLVLQMLQTRELISYRQDKTNIEYLRELEQGELSTYFRQMMRQYEFTWYGNYLPTPAAFQNYIQTYDSLKIKLSNR